MDDPVPDFAALWNELAKASPEEVLEALKKAGLLSREQLAQLQTFGARNTWTAFNTKSMLGGALLGQARQLQPTDATSAAARFTESEPLLVQGYEGMQQRVDQIPPEGKIRLIEALERLVNLYIDWGKSDEAAKWQQKLEEAQAAETEAAGAAAVEAKADDAQAAAAKTEEEKVIDDADKEKKP